jgi:uncharacterized repeat protein (TIGR03943 family)
MQTVVPQDVFTGALTTPLVGAALLIVLAFVLSLCSEADAFVAVSLIQFPLGAQLSFLVFGRFWTSSSRCSTGRPSEVARAPSSADRRPDRARGINAVPGGDRMTLDWTRLLRGLTVLAWAAFFDWLWLSDRASLYVGPRTHWVVVFGAITLTAVALVYLAAVPSREPTRAPRASELGRLGVLVGPLILAAMAPAVTLGAQAVDRKRVADGAALARRLADDGTELRLYELAAAASNAKWARARGIEPGMKVAFDGFVSRQARNGTIELSRFTATCCAADAVPYTIDVRLHDAADSVEQNQWLHVRGRVGPRTKSVEAESIEQIEQPVDAYG